MRIPIQASDLDARTGALDRNASILRRYWPAVQPISLFEARRMISLALGYKNPREMRTAAVILKSSTGNLPSSTISASLTDKIYHSLKGNPACPNFTKIFHAVSALPLHLFSAIDDDQDSRLYETIPHHTAERKHSNCARLLTEAEICAIADVVADTSSTSWQLMFRLLDLGFKATLVAEACTDSNGYIRIDNVSLDPFSLARISRNRTPFSIVPPGAYLFTASSDCRKPISVSRIARKFRSWVIESGIGHDGITLHVFRRSVDARRFNQVALALNHSIP